MFWLVLKCMWCCTNLQSLPPSITPRWTNSMVLCNTYIWKYTTCSKDWECSATAVLYSTTPLSHPEATRAADVTIVGWKSTLQVRCWSRVRDVVSHVNRLSSQSLRHSPGSRLSLSLSLSLFLSGCWLLSVCDVALLLCLLVCFSVFLIFGVSIQAFNFSEAQCFQKPFWLHIIFTHDWLPSTQREKNPSPNLRINSKFQRSFIVTVEHRGVLL